MDSKAQGRTFWIVVTAIVALVVLVILVIIFTGNTKKLGIELLNCEGKGGFCTKKGSGTEYDAQCKSECKNQDYSGCSYSSAFGCKEETKICCLGVKK